MWRRMTVGLLGVVTAACGGDATSPEARVDRVEVSYDSVRLLMGGSRTVSAWVYDVNGAPVTGSRGAVQWSSSDEGVAAVLAAGVVHALAPGQATVLAQAQGASKAIDVQVLMAAGRLELRKVNGKPLPLSLNGRSGSEDVVFTVTRGSLLFGTSGMWGTTYPGYSVQVFYETSGAVSGGGMLSLGGSYSLSGRTGITLRDFGDTYCGAHDGAGTVVLHATIRGGPEVELTFGR